MNHLTWLLLLLLLPACAYADDLYQIRPLSEQKVLTTYLNMMRDACRHSDKDWHAWPADPQGGYWGNGLSDGNEGIRAVAGMVLTSGALLKYSDSLTDADRRDLSSKAAAAVRYVVSTHLSGTKNCVDGKKWGGSWQSAMWTSTFAFGAWLMWDELDSELREGVERVLASEADRFLNVKPPSGRWFDTKAEENGWDLTCISLAANMLASHPHAKAWNDKALEYMMNTLSVAKDKRDETLVDGRPVKEWVSTENLHPDFTLENHGMFHPSYVQCSSYFLTQCAMHCALARRPVPQAASHHLMDTWGMFQSLLLPSGETIFPQGMDWELHNLPAINLFASLACWKDDPLAADMERRILQYMRAWQEQCGGDLTLPGSKLGFTRHAIQAEQVTFGYLAHKLFGPATERPAPAAQPFARHYSLIDVVMHRTKSKLLSFSWKNRILGMLAPIEENHPANPIFTVPIANGLLGSFEISPGKDAALKVIERKWKKTPSGLETTGVLQTSGGLLEQTLRIVSVGEKAVVYQDSVRALSDLTVTRELGVPLGIENDSLTGGKRTVFHRDGKITFDWKTPAKPVAVPGSWANVDGRLGVVSAAGSGIAYAQAAGYDRTAVCPDILYGSFSDRRQSFKAGEQVARRLLVLFVETTPEETRALSESVRIEDKSAGKLLRFKLPEGGEAEVSLPDDASVQ